MKIGKRLLHILVCVICVTVVCINSSFSSYVSAEGEMTWASLQEPVNEGGEIALTNDVVAGAGDAILTVPEGVEITIDLNGHNIDRNQPEMYSSHNGAVILVNGKLTINGERKIRGGDNGDVSGIGGGVIVNGTFIMNGGSVCENAAAGGGYAGGVTVNGTFIMNGGDISYNGAYSGGGVIVNTNGNFTMNAGTINENTGSVYGGGVLIRNGIFTMNGGSITSNHAGLSGHGVYVYDTAAVQFNISGTVNITGNSYAGRTQNVYLTIDKKINVIGTLNEDSSIGVSTQSKPSNTNAVVLTEGLDTRGSVSSFFSDAEFEVFENSDGEAVIGGSVVTVSFSPGEGSGEMPSKSMLSGSTYELPECVFTAPEGKDFGGWQSGEEVYEEKEEVTISGDTVFTALWIDHDWEDPVYEWSDDNKTVTASRTCRNTGHSETETVETTSVVKIEATCTEKGTTEYTAVFTNEAFETQIREVEDIEVRGHNWGEWEIVIAPTESEDGLRVRICLNECGSVEREVIPAVFVYRFTEGASGSWTRGSGETLFFKVNRSKDDDTAFSHYSHIEIDGETPDLSAYTAEEGSLDITLNAEYLEELAKGTHTIKAVFDDGEAETTFTIKEKKQDGPSKDDGPAADTLYSVPDTYAEMISDRRISFLPLMAVTVLGTLVMIRKRNR
ncbi:MAG: hypothetical protein IKF68_03145 [Erysipelotrichaceae bacterium]|nr:hypothetical protein [Erysipelotrichaceae bacterium]